MSNRHIFEIGCLKLPHTSRVRSYVLLRIFSLFLYFAFLVSPITGLASIIEIGSFGGAYGKVVFSNIAIIDGTDRYELSFLNELVQYGIKADSHPKMKWPKGISVTPEISKCITHPKLSGASFPLNVKKEILFKWVNAVSMKYRKNVLNLRNDMWAITYWEPINVQSAIDSLDVGPLTQLGVSFPLKKIEHTTDYGLTLSWENPDRNNPDVIVEVREWNRLMPRFFDDALTCLKPQS